MAHRFRDSIAALGLTLLMAVACDAPTPLPVPDAATHATDIATWHAERIRKLELPDGWLSLVGLHWIRPGTNTFGADAANDFVYNRNENPLPLRIGTFTLVNDSVRFDAEPGVPITHVDTTVSSILMFDRHADGSSPPVTLRHGSVEWLVIGRAGRLAVRVRDAQSEVRTTFAGIETYPPSLTWRFPARFVRRDPPDTIEVPNVIGTVNRTPSPGLIEFRFNGRKHRVAMWIDSDDPANFFTAFADRTNGSGTYGGGRFLWVDAPDADGWTIIDFNKAYNPPCVFTEFATCPLPPLQNRLPFAIEAGEKAWH
jgi:uncharacterized protein (DUF1684 family)